MTGHLGWDEDVREHCFLLWRGVGGRNAARTAWLYRQELPDDMPSPAARTIRHWSVVEDWPGWASGDVPPVPRGNNWHRWSTMWVRHVMRQVRSALAVHTDVLLGGFDDDPGAGAAALTEAGANLQRVLTQPGVRALFRLCFSGEGRSRLPLADRERRLRQSLRCRRRNG